MDHRSDSANDQPETLESQLTALQTHKKNGKTTLKAAQKQLKKLLKKKARLKKQAKQLSAADLLELARLKAV